MKLNRILIALVLVAALMLGAISVSAQESTGTAQVRVAHFAVDAPAVDVFVNGSAVLEGVPYQAVSRYLTVPAATALSIAVAPAGAGISAAVIGPVDLEFAAGNAYTVAATGQLADGSFGPNVINETALLAPIQGDYTADIIVLHGISNAPAVDIRLANGTVIAGNIAFNQAVGISVPEGSYPLVVTVAGTQTVVFNDLNPVRLNGSSQYLIAATGRLGTNATLSSTVTPNASLADIINNAPGFETLSAAINAAGLSETLDTAGPFTVFVPSNEAFAALPAGTIDALLADPSGALTNILLYHVVNGAAYSPTVVATSEVTTLNGQNITITVRNGKVYLNDTVEVSLVDIAATNGAIHVISSVLLPAAE